MVGPGFIHKQSILELKQWNENLYNGSIIGEQLMNECDKCLPLEYQLMCGSQLQLISQVITGFEENLNLGNYNKHCLLVYGTCGSALL